MGLLIVLVLSLTTLAFSVVQAEQVERPYIAFAAMPFRGHATPVHALAQELSDRGYATDFITMDSPAITDAFARAIGPRYISLFSFDSVCSAEDLHLGLLVATGEMAHRKLSPAQEAAVWRCFFGVYEHFLPAITRRFVERRPDLVVADYVMLGAIDAALNLSIPLVINTPSVFSTESFNLPTGWTAYHSWDANALAAGGIFASLRRWVNHTLRRFLLIVAAESPVVHAQQHMRETYGDASSANLALSSSVPNMVNIFFGLEYAQPVPPQYILIGPVLSREAEAQAIGDVNRESKRQKTENCPEMLWLDELVRENAKIDVILVNFGTTGVFKPRQFQTMLEGFAALQANETTSAFRVLWRISEEQYQHAFDPGNKSNPPIPSSIHFVPWFCSQAAVLRHPAVRLFVSHAGINSAQEAILTGVPILAIPSFGDQNDMAVRIADSGVGLSLPPDNFTPHRFSRAVAQILDPQARFSVVAQELRGLLLSDPAGFGRARGADVIEDVLRRGYKHLVPLEALKEPAWARAGLDVTLVDIVAVVGLLWILKHAAKSVWRAVRSTQRRIRRRSVKQD